MKNPLGIILTLAGIGLAIYGITLFGDSTESASVLGLEFSATDNDMQWQAFLFIGLGVVALVGGLFVMKRK